MKYRKTRCNELIKGTMFPLWGFQPIDLRKKYFVCINCKKEHLTKTNVERK